MFAGWIMQFVAMGFALDLSVLYPEFVRQLNATRSSAALVQGMCFGIIFSGGMHIEIYYESLWVKQITKETHS